MILNGGINMISSIGSYSNSTLMEKNEVDISIESKYTKYPEYLHIKYDVSVLDSEHFFNRAILNLENILNNISSNNFLKTIEFLDSLNYMLRSAIHSEHISTDLKNELDIMLINLENTEYTFQNKIKEGTLKEFINNSDIMTYIKGTKNMIEAIENIDEWKEKMNKEWGG